jgi:hypothetical protein
MPPDTTNYLYRLNHEAYMDVLDCKAPRYSKGSPHYETYMSCYRAWYPLGGEYLESEYHHV